MQIHHPLLFALVASAATALADSFSDDFDDGDAAGWTQSSPLAALGTPGIFSFPDGNAFRIQTTTPSADPEVFGPARAGAYIATLNQSDFRIIVDLVDWDDFLLQDIGILARISTPGLGSLNAYGFSYDNNGGSFFLTRIEDEKPTTLASGGFFIEPSRNYRLTFQGFGPELLAVVIDLEDPEFPVAELFAFDDTHTGGFPGLFNNGLGDAALTDATFDNFHADALPDTDFDSLPDPWEASYYGDNFGTESADTDKDGLTSAEEYAAGTDPTDPSSKLQITSVSSTGDTLRITFSPALPDRNYRLELSGDLSSWQTATEAQITVEGDAATFTLPSPTLRFSAARIAVSPPR